MASRFHEIDRLAQDSQTEHNGEPVTITPYIQSDYTGQADPGRAVKTVMAVVMVAAESMSFKGNLRGDENVSGTRFSSAPSIIWLSKAEADKIGYDLSKGDRIVTETYGTFVVQYVAKNNLGEQTIHVASET